YNRLEAFELGHAIRKLQAVSTPMNYRLRGAEIAYLLNDSGASVIVAGPEFTEAVDEARPDVENAGGRHWLVYGNGPAPQGWELFEEHVARGAETEPEPPPGVTGPTMVYTAGTTGDPKGAYRPGGTPVDIILQFIAAFGLTSDDV